MLWPLARAQALAWGSAALLWLPLPHWAWTVLNDTGGALFFGSGIGFGVVLMWNIAHPDHEARDERQARLEERRREMRERAERLGWDKPVTPRGVPRIPAVQRHPTGHEAFKQDLETVLAGGTARYLGPPPIFTPPHGMEVVIRVDLHAEPTIGWRLGAHVASDECDECGEPMDTAWIKPGAPRVCRPCLTHGMTGYNAPEPHPGTCDQCGDRTGMCMRAGEDHGHLCYHCAYGSH